MRREIATSNGCKKQDQDAGIEVARKRMKQVR
jgi:hypothetical protein